MVTRDSAGLSGLNCPAEPLENTDHSTLIKFEQRHGSYEKVSGYLKDWVEKLRSKRSLWK